MSGWTVLAKHEYHTFSPWIMISITTYSFLTRTKIAVITLHRVKWTVIIHILSLFPSPLVEWNNTIPLQCIKINHRNHKKSILVYSFDKHNSLLDKF